MPGKAQSKLIRNPRVRFDYDIKETLTVGIMLSGAETRSVREGHAAIRGSYVIIKDGELWLVNANISGTKNAPITEDEVTRSRKLLATKKEIDKLTKLKDQGMTIVPLDLNRSTNFIKLTIVAGASKRKFDKRQAIKAREEKLKIQRFKKIS